VLQPLFQALGQAFDGPDLVAFGLEFGVELELTHQE